MYINGIKSLSLFTLNLNQMKKIAFIIGILAVCSLTMAQTRVIDYPSVEKRTDESLEFYRVIVSDTALILEGNLYHRPNYWVKVSSASVLKGRNTGKTYRLIRATGIKLDEKEYMPESWNKAFALHFEPIDSRDESIDYVSPDGDQFGVSGICVKKRKEKKKVHCLIEGEVVDNPAYSRMMLMPEGADARVVNWISIPVNEGKFRYDLYVDKEDAYSLIPWSDQMRGSWKPVTFFAENKKKVNLVLYSPDRSAKLESDAPLTKELIRFEKEWEEELRPLIEELEKLQQEGRLETPEMMSLHEQHKKEKDESGIQYFSM